MTTTLDDHALDLLFRQARTHKEWKPGALAVADLQAIYALARMAPTSANTNPGRFVFVVSKDGKERLKAHLAPPNVGPTMAAPCCVIVAQDKQFAEFMPRLMPGKPLPFISNPALVEETATRNSTLQGAYMMLAARALGFDVGPMSGFNRASLDADFFPDGRWSSNFLFNLGHGANAELPPRNARLEFDEACLMG